MNKIKVVHIINNLEIGGAERLLASLVEEQAKTPRLEVEVISLEGHGPLEESIHGTGIKLTNFHYKIFHTGFFSKVLSSLEPYFRPGLFFYLKKTKPDLLHGHLLVGEDFAKVAGWLLGIPVVATVHDAIHKQGLKQRFLNRFLSKAVAVSPEVKEHIINSYRMAKSSIVIIPNAINFGSFGKGIKKFDSKTPVFLYIGRITAGKGLSYAIKGLAALLPKHPGLTFEIFGKGVHLDDENELRNFVIDNEWEFVHFNGSTDDVPGALAKGDIFVLPSKSEGFSLAILEAAAAHKPIISTKVGIARDIITEGENGYFMEYGVEATVTLAASRILKGNVEKMGEKSFANNIGRFTIEKTAEMYYNLYLEVIS